MADYITLPVVTNPQEILREMIADFEARVPGWTPNPGAPEVVAMSIFALRHSVKLAAATQVADTVYQDFGTSLKGVPFSEATYASVDATATIGEAYRAEPHTIPAGLRVSIEGPEGPVGFEVAEAVEVPAETETVTVSLRAEEAGSAGSGLTGEVSIRDARTWLQTITLLAETSGGADEEEEEAYRERLARKVRRDSEAVITAADAQQALLELPGIGRALILDEYVPASEGKEAEEDVLGAATAVVCTTDGSDCSTATKREALEIIEARRLEKRFVSFHVIDPTRTGLTIAFAYTTSPGYDPDVVGQLGVSAIEWYLSNGQWGAGSTPEGARFWEEENKVRFGEVYAALYGVRGLDHVNKVLLNGNEEDVTIAGPGALPTATSITPEAE